MADQKRECVCKDGVCDLPADPTSADRKKACAPKRCRLSDLLAGMTPENRHDEVDMGPPVGREFPNDHS
jgi:hypothetical protein